MGKGHALPKRKKRKKPEFPRPARGRAVQIAPSILAADFSNLRREINTVRRCGIRWIHLDIMDGHFVPNLSFGPGLVHAIRNIDPQLYFDCHLMVEKPRDMIREFIDAGAQQVTIHSESSGVKLCEDLQYIRRKGVNAGLSIKPKTQVSDVQECLEYADLVLVMTVEPGFGGQKLIPNTLNKVRQLSHLREELKTDYLIQVDGGINCETAHLAVAAGSDVLVAGSSVFQGGRIRENLRQLRKSLETIR